MRKTEELYWLIKKLEPQEKSYFKKFTQKHSREEENKYVMLFDEINALNTPDEINGKKFQNLIVKKKLGNYLSDQKNHLINIIMKAMRNFHGNKNADMQLKDMWKDILFFKERELRSLYYKTIIKAKQLAISYEKYGYILDLYDEEIFYHSRNVDKNHAETVNQLYVEKDLYLERYNKIQRLKKIKTNLFQNRNIYSSEQKFQLNVDDMIFLQNISQEELNISFVIANHYYVIQYTIEQFNKGYIQSYEWSKKLLNLYKLYPQFKFEQLNAYCNQITNHLVLGVNAADFDGILLFIKEIRSDKRLKDNHTLFLEMMHNELIIYLNNRDFEKIDLISESLYAAIRDKNVLKSNKTILKTFYHLSLSHFIRGNYEKMLPFLKEIQTYPIEIKQPNYYKSKLLSLICYFELSQLELLQDALRNIKREKNFNEYLKYVDTGFFDLMKELMRRPDDKYMLISGYSAQFTGLDDICIWFKHNQVPVS